MVNHTNFQVKPKDKIKNISNWKVVRNGVVQLTNKNMNFAKKEKINFVMESEIITTVQEIGNLIIVI